MACRAGESTGGWQLGDLSSRKAKDSVKRQEVLGKRLDVLAKQQEHFGKTSRRIFQPLKTSRWTCTDISTDMSVHLDRHVGTSRSTCRYISIDKLKHPSRMLVLRPFDHGFKEPVPYKGVSGGNGFLAWSRRDLPDVDDRLGTICIQLQHIQQTVGAVEGDFTHDEAALDTRPDHVGLDPTGVAE